MIRPGRQTGYILLPVIVVITLVAAIALLMNTESALESNTAASELDAQQAQYVAEAGMNHALWLTRQQGCSAYGNLTDEPIGNDKYTTALTTDLGVTTNYSIVVDQDNWIRNDIPTNNHAADTRLHIRFEKGNSERPMFRYDLSSIPSKAAILSATAWFYVNKAHAEGPVDVHQITADWTEADATWDSMGTNLDSAVIATIPAQPTLGVWVSVNLTSQVQAWVNGQPNYGITLNSTNEGTHGEYFSRESANVPYLEVIVGAPPTSPALLKAVGTLDNGVVRTITRDDVTLYQHPPSLFQFQPDATQAIDSYIWAANKTTNYGTDDETWAATGASNEALALFKFDLADFPAGARIRGASLSLYHRSGNDPNVPVSAHRITNDWNESEVTWNKRDNANDWDNPGGDYDAEAVSSTSVDATGPGAPNPQRYEWDISSLVLGWVNGSFANHGVVLRTEQAGSNGERFDTSDHADPTRHPRLNIRYSCACGEVCVTPQGSGKIGMIGNWPGPSPDQRDQDKESIIESWGYEVDQWDDNFIWAIDFNNYDLVYISETASSAAVIGQISWRSIGVVNEQSNLNPDFGFATGNGTSVGDSVDITDNSHYISAPFALGSLPIYSAPMEMVSTSGTLAGGGQTLAEASGAESLMLLDAGAPSVNGAAAGKRVALPLGRATNSNFDWTYLNNNGRLLVQRSIEWASGAKEIVVNEPIILSTESGATLGGLSFTDKDLAEYDPGTDNGSLYLDGAVLSLAQDIDAVHILENDHIVLSAINTITMGGITSENEDLIVYDPVADSAILMFDGSALFTSGSTDISAVHVLDNSHLLLTNEYSATLGGLSFGPNDIIDYDPATNSATLFFDGDAVGFSAWINAVHLLANGHVVLSTNTAATLGSLSFDPGDLIDYDPVADSATLYLDGGLFSAAENIRSAHLGTGSGDDGTAPVAHWKLDETIDFTAMDSEGGHDGTLTNGPAWSGGQLGGGLQFDGSNDFINVAHDDNLSLDKFTISAWISTDTVTGFHSIVYKGATAADANYHFYTHNDEIRLGLTNGGWQYFVASTTANLTAGEWYHVATTVDGSSGEVKLYLDGNLIQTANIGVSILTNTGPITIGSDPFNEHWDGRLDDVRIYNKVLSDAEVAELAALPGPIAHWKLDDGAGLTAVDSVSTNDGTLNGPPAWTGGVIGDALDFDGGNDYVDVGSFDVSGSGITLMGWFKADSLPDSTDPRILSKASTIAEADAWWQLSILTTGGNANIRFRTKAGGTTSTLIDSSTNLNIGQWYFAAATYHAATGAMKLYLDGIEVASQSHPVGGPVDVNEAVPVAIGANGSAEQFFDGVLDDVRVYDRMLGNSEIASIAAEGGGGGGGSSSYTELYQTWSATNDNSWQTMDLSLFVPADAVVEVAIVNANTGKERWGGVRALGSSLERRFRLHEAENGGVDTVTMHVQVDSSSQIQHFSEKKAEVSFILLGYWTGATYVERFDAFKAGANASWESHDLGVYGVGANQVAEIALSQTSTSVEWLVGARRPGSGLTRRLSLHEAEAGGIDMVSMMVGTDASSIVEVYAEANSVIDFHLLGYWSTPPGTYTETGGVHGQATVSASWQTTDLSSFGVPANSIAQFVMSNERDANENQMGLRETGSAIPNRRLDLQEAESGGGDLGTMHVRVDAGSQVQWAAEYGATEGYFYPVGWWVLSP